MIKCIIAFRDFVFIEDYAFLINALNDLSEKTMNFKYKDLAKKLSKEAISKFYIEDKNIFQKILKIPMMFFSNQLILVITQFLMATLLCLSI